MIKDTCHLCVVRYVCILAEDPSKMCNSNHGRRGTGRHCFLKERTAMFCQIVSNEELIQTCHKFDRFVGVSAM